MPLGTQRKISAGYRMDRDTVVVNGGETGESKMTKGQFSCHYNVFLNE